MKKAACIFIIFCVFVSKGQHDEDRNFPQSIDNHLSYRNLSSATGNTNATFKNANILLERYDDPALAVSKLAYALLGTKQQDKALPYAIMAYGAGTLDSGMMIDMYNLSIQLKNTGFNDKTYKAMVLCSMVKRGAVSAESTINRALNHYSTYPEYRKIVSTNLNNLADLKKNYQGIAVQISELINTKANYTNTEAQKKLSTYFNSFKTAHDTQLIDEVIYTQLLQRLALFMDIHDLEDKTIENEMLVMLSRKRNNPQAQYKLYKSYIALNTSRDPQSVIEAANVFVSQPQNFFQPQQDQLYLDILAAAYRTNNRTLTKTILDKREQRLSRILNPHDKMAYLVHYISYYSAANPEKGSAYYEEFKSLAQRYGRTMFYKNQIDTYDVQFGLKNISSDEASASMLYTQALNKLRSMDYAAMLPLMESALIKIKQDLKTATSAEQEKYQSLYHNILTTLAGTYVKNRQPIKALEIAEEFKNVLLNNKLKGNSTQKTSVDDVQKVLEPDEAIIYYFSPNTQSPDGLFVFLISKNDVSAEYFDGTVFSAETLSRYPKIAAYTEQKLSKKELRESIDLKRPKFNKEYIAQPQDQRIALEMYRMQLAPSPDDMAYQNPQAMMRMSKRLNQYYIPEQNLLKPFKKLIISPAGNLSFIPFETLTHMMTSRMLLQDYEISYIPSASVLVSLRNESETNYEKNILAFGDATYSLRKDQSTKVQSITDVRKLQLRVNASIARGENLDYAFAALQGDKPMDYLIGTKREVLAIDSLIPKTDVRLNENMTENELKRMSKSGELNKYKVIHLASHASVNPYIFELSGLAMTVFPTPQDGEDGMITVSEMGELDMNPDLVMLSACETGLGRITSGDTVQGLNNALLSAGANGTLTSLWPVNDYATSLFVQEFYKLVFLENVPYSSAVTQIKRRFVAGEFGEQLKHPKYWAPFIYYGK